MINETYDSMQNDLFAQIHGLEMQLKELDEDSNRNAGCKMNELRECS